MSAPNRARRFTIPDLGDQRVDEAIDSFLSGPEHRRGRREPDALPGPGTNVFARLETRIAWLEALRRESARSTRYRRPAAVIVIAAETRATGALAAEWLARVAGPIAHAVQRDIRETDLVTRTGDARFQVLLPETTEREARHVTRRIAADCQVWLDALQAPVTVRTASAATGPDVSLETALERALHQVEGPARA